MSPKTKYNGEKEKRKGKEGIMEKIKEEKEKKRKWK